MKKTALGYNYRGWFISRSCWNGWSLWAPDAEVGDIYTSQAETLRQAADYIDDVGQKWDDAEHAKATLETKS